VPANEIVGLLPGELFVHRNVANVVVHSDLNCLSVMQFAIEALRVEHVIVCGHYGCSRAAATLQGERVGLADKGLRHVHDVHREHAPRPARRSRARSRHEGDGPGRGQRGLRSRARLALGALARGPRRRTAGLPPRATILNPPAPAAHGKVVGMIEIDVTAIDSTYPRLGALYALVREVYATSDYMSEAVDERYPCALSLAAEIGGVAGRPGGLFLVAEIARQPRGFLIVEPRRAARLRHTADLHMGVRSGARGLGIGRALVAAAQERVTRSGAVELVYLMVRADNAAAIRLYERAGFATIAKLARDTKIGECYYDGVLMRWARE
jgi:GNAT superfamily N-acetyltransferase